MKLCVPIYVCCAELPESNEKRVAAAAFVDSFSTYQIENKLEYWIRLAKLTGETWKDGAAKVFPDRLPNYCRIVTCRTIPIMIEPWSCAYSWDEGTRVGIRRVWLCVKSLLQAKERLMESVLTLHPDWTVCLASCVMFNRGLSAVMTILGWSWIYHFATLSLILTILCLRRTGKNEVKWTRKAEVLRHTISQ